MFWSFSHSGVVIGLAICVIIAVVFGIVQHIYKTHQALKHLQALLAEADARHKQAELERYGLRHDLFTQTEKRERAEELLRQFSRPQPSPHPVEFVPGLLAAMQRAVAGATSGASNPAELVCSDGSQKNKYFDTAASVVVMDDRPLPPAIDDAKPDPQQLQGKEAASYAKPHAMTADEVSARVGSFKTRQNAITAAIHREALETAAEALDPEKRAMLWAEGGDAAVYAYVAPAVQQALAELEEQTHVMTAALLNPIQCKPEQMEAFKRGLELISLPTPALNSPADA